MPYLFISRNASCPRDGAILACMSVAMKTNNKWRNAERDPRFAVKYIGNRKGMGLFAAGRIPKGAFIDEYSGKKIHTLEADASKSRYIFEIDEDWSIDAETADSFARYINHSCNPNTEAQIEEGRINIYTTRSIKTGEEITIDYGKEYFDEFIRPRGCKCAAVKHL